MRRIFKRLSALHWLYSVLHVLVLLIALDVVTAITTAAISASTWHEIHLYLIGGLWALAATSMAIMLYLHLLEDRKVFKRSRKESLPK